MKAKTLIVLVFLIPLLSLYSAAGFDMRLNRPVPIYAEWDISVPFEEKPLLTQLKPGDHMLSLGCFDYKTDIVFQISLPDGRFGYLYDVRKYTSTKRFIPDAIGLKYFLSDPIASLQCLIMVPEYSVN